MQESLINFIYVPFYNYKRCKLHRLEKHASANKLYSKNVSEQTPKESHIISKAGRRNSQKEASQGGRGWLALCWPDWAY